MARCASGTLHAAGAVVSVSDREKSKQLTKAAVAMNSLALTLT